MKKQIALLFSLQIVNYIFNFSHAQVIQWQRSLGGTLTDAAYAIIQTRDSGYLTSGYSYSQDGDVTGWHDQKEEWVVKLDKNGNVQWQKCLGGNGDDICLDIVEATDGGYVLAGGSNSTTGDVTGLHGFFVDYWVVKLDTVGNILWQKCLGGSSDDDGQAIVRTFDGGYAISGSAGSNDGDVTMNHGTQDYWMVKLDSAGNLLWEKTYGGSFYDINESLVQTADSGFALIGETESIDGDITGQMGSRDYWVVKTDKDGNLQWQKCLGGSASDWGTAIANTADNGLIVIGFSYSSDSDVTFNHGNGDIWVAKLDINGNIQWQKSLGSTFNDQSYSVMQVPDGTYVVAGQGGANDGDLSGTHGSGDYWVINLDTNGTIIKSKNYGGLNSELSFRVIQTFDGGFALTGYATSSNGDLNENKGGYDYWIVKLTNEFNSITGKVFADFNSNQIQDINEPAIPDHKLTEVNTQRLAFSELSGDYDLSVLDSGNYTVYPAPINYYNTVPAINNIFFPGINQVDSLNDFAFQPTGNFNDLCVTISPAGNFVAGFNTCYIISYENSGTTTINGTVIFFPDNDLTFVTSDIIPVSVTTDSIIWDVGALAPFQTGNIVVTVNVNLIVPVGTLVNSLVRIDPVAGDANTACNYDSWEDYTEPGSFDPNAIRVDRDTVLTTELSNPPFLNYIIYFQNTGTDTAFNIKVLNNIPVKLELSSFEIIAASHPVNIHYGAHSRLMEFDFDNILLPDSNVNEVGSHGFIRYRIKPLTTLVAGKKIKNAAAIYFDFNQPVLTNTATTSIEQPTGINELNVESSLFKVFPNPVKDYCKLQIENLELKKNSELKIYDIFGREVFQSESALSGPKSEIKINVSGYASGIYLLEIKSENNLYRTKLLKQ